LVDTNFKKLKDHEKIIIKNTKIQINYLYPLNNPTIIEHENENGFNFSEIIKIICIDYYSIYETENSTSTIKESYLNFSENRNTTNGHYSIWFFFSFKNFKGVII
jgi:hypothetical protein